MSEPSIESSDQPARELKILIVDDHGDTTRVMARLLKGRGYDVCTANSVRSALDEAARCRFDLLISDIGLPDGTGLDLMRRLREQGPIRGIALSGRSLDEDRDESHAAGFSIHLIKPIDFAKLQQVIEDFPRG